MAPSAVLRHLEHAQLLELSQVAAHRIELVRGQHQDLQLRALAKALHGVQLVVVHLELAQRWQVVEACDRDVGDERWPEQRGRGTAPQEGRRWWDGMGRWVGCWSDVGYGVG